MKVLDSTFLIDLLHGDTATKKIAMSEEVLLTTQINMFEVLTGIFYHQNPKKEVLKALELFENMRMLELNDNEIINAAKINADLTKKGLKIDDNDCLIAGIILAHNIETLITRNTKHFKSIKGIKVETY
jgi:predicted nucleic acid-binding protein